MPALFVQHLVSPSVFYDTSHVLFLLLPLFSTQKHLASAGGLKMKEGQRQQHNKPSTPKKDRRGGGVREFNTQPEGPRGVSNCVIKYVTGSLDASVEAWSHAITVQRRATYAPTHTRTHSRLYICKNMYIFSVGSGVKPRLHAYKSHTVYAVIVSIYLLCCLKCEDKLWLLRFHESVPFEDLLRETGTDQPWGQYIYMCARAIAYMLIYSMILMYESHIRNVCIFVLRIANQWGDVM